ncbi:hypothetical protein AB4Z38_14275 [Arthrobacter sp. 2RAF6]|uniref:hypothetical protein n=1 Tax=Arthrobacter sp. 2RAF6 TaxID=3233002 RepID=UPI003F91906A
MRLRPLKGRGVFGWGTGGKLPRVAMCSAMPWHFSLLSVELIIITLILFGSLAEHAWR